MEDTSKPSLRKSNDRRIKMQPWCINFIVHWFSSCHHQFHCTLIFILPAHLVNHDNESSRRIPASGHQWWWLLATSLRIVLQSVLGFYSRTVYQVYNLRKIAYKILFGDVKTKSADEWTDETNLRRKKNREEKTWKKI